MQRAVVRPVTPGGWGIAAGVAVLALVVRWNLVGGVAGLRGYHGYDDGVYFAAAVAFVHDHVPYRDFLLLHPPGIVLALTPFAALGRLTGDSTAFVAARVGFLLVGAANTVLVTRITRRWGTVAAVVGGVLYALSAAAASVEQLTLLEPLGTLSLLGAVVLLLRASDAGAARWWMWAGAVVLGLGVDVKIWAVVPVLVVLGWQAAVRGWRTAVGIGVVAAATAVVVALPFVVVAGPAMLRYVLLDQLGRGRTEATIADRLAGIVGANVSSGAVHGALLAVVLAALVAAGVVAWRGQRGRLWVVMLGAQTAVLLVSPSYFPHYAAYTAAAVVLVVAAAVSLVPTRSRTTVAAVVCVGLALVGGAVRPAPPFAFPAAEITAQLPAGCIRTDSPATLVLLDVLSRDLDNGCRVLIDPSGQTFDQGGRDAQGRPVPRVSNQQYQRDVVQYLTSGSATVLARAVGNGFDAETQRQLGELRVGLQRGGIRLLFPDPTPSAESAP